MLPSSVRTLTLNNPDMNPLSFRRLGYSIGVMASDDSIIERSKPNVEARLPKAPALPPDDSDSSATSVSEVYVRGMHMMYKHDNTKTVGRTIKYSLRFDHTACMTALMSRLISSVCCSDCPFISIDVFPDLYCGIYSPHIDIYIYNVRFPVLL